MTVDRNEWIDSVWATLRNIPTGGEADELESAWLEHSSQKRPVAVIYGAYDSGKSSLLKRLLFEDEASIPNWVTVSARRETFSVDEVDGATWTFRDSPGLAGGNDEHRFKALESLDLADLFIWVLPNQLVTTDKETFAEIVTGRRFNVSPEHVAKSLVSVIGRIDEAGVDPSENIAGFREHCERKRREFATFMSSIEATAPRWGIHTVSADPYQVVGNDPPDGDLYAMGDAWDGIAELKSALTDALSDVAELRTLSGYRFASKALSDFSQQIQKERKQREEAYAIAENELERVSLWHNDVEAIRRKCVADLSRVVEEELNSVSRIGEAARDVLPERLAETIDRWSDSAFAELEQLATSAGQEAVERGRNPPTEHLKNFIERMNEDDDRVKKSINHTTINKHVSGIGRAFRESFNAYARKEINMSLDEASKRIREFNDSGQSWHVFKAAKKGKTFGSKVAADKASMYVKWGETLNIVAPLLEQLGPLMFEVGSEVISTKEANQKAQRRQNLRDKLREQVEAFEKQARTGFDDAIAEFDKSLDQQRGIHQAAKDALSAQLSELKRYEAKLEYLIQTGR